MREGGESKEKAEGWGFYSSAVAHCHQISEQHFCIQLCFGVFLFVNCACRTQILVWCFTPPFPMRKEKFLGCCG